MGCCGGSNDMVLKVEGMSCGHCKMTVEKALNAVPGVTAAEVNLAAKEVKISGNFERQAAVEAIEKVGFDVVG